LAHQRSKNCRFAPHYMLENRGIWIFEFWIIIFML